MANSFYIITAYSPIMDTLYIAEISSVSNTLSLVTISTPCGRLHPLWRMYLAYCCYWFTIFLADKPLGLRAGKRRRGTNTHDRGGAIVSTLHPFADATPLSTGKSAALLGGCHSQSLLHTSAWYSDVHIGVIVILPSFFQQPPNSSRTHLHPLP